MELQLVSKEVAILAKKLGFDWPVSNYLISSVNDNRQVCYPRINVNKVINFISLPEQELLAKWLRDIHNIHVIPDKVGIADLRKDKFRQLETHIVYLSWYNNKQVSYEAALEINLKEALLQMKRKS